MGREGVYAEDRTDVYTGGTGSSTQSTGSGSAGGMFFNQGLHLGEGIGGTPSPSFFPIKPSEKLVQQFRDTPLDVNFSSGKGNNSTLLHHKMPMRDRLATPPLPSSMLYGNLSQKLSLIAKSLSLIILYRFTTLHLL